MARSLRHCRVCGARPALWYELCLCGSAADSCRHEDAATTSGAGRAFIVLRVVLALIAPALVSGSLFVFLVTVQSVSLPLLLVGPGTELIAVALFDLWQNGQVTELAAMGVLWMCFILIVSAAFYVVTRRYQLSA
jgi:iron(III) transport system permease protein